MTEIDFSCEMTLYIHHPGIAPVFLDWIEERIQSEREADGLEGYEPQNYEHSRQGTAILNTMSLRVFTVDGMWEMGVPKDGRLGEPKDMLCLHVYPNVPMQVLHKELPKFLATFGIDSFELRVPRYARCVEKAINYLLGQDDEVGDG